MQLPDLPQGCAAIARLELRHGRRLNCCIGIPDSDVEPIRARAGRPLGGS
jgi:hypothetical protein